MFRKTLLVSVALAAAFAQDDPPWKSKQIAAWNEDDVKLVLARSPWAKSFTPTLLAAQDTGMRQNGMGRGMGGGMGGMGGGIGTGGGMNRRGMGGIGYPTDSPGGYPNSRSNDTLEPQPVILRWESAMPIRTAALKVPDGNPPSFDENHYAIAVYGIPDRMLNGDPQKLADQLKRDVSLKRQGKKDFKPSSVEVLDEPKGRVVVYLFPRSTEITRQDHRVEFNAKIGRFELRQSFFVDEMVWDGKLEL